MKPKLSSKAERLLERMEIRSRFANARKPVGDPPAGEPTFTGGLMHPDKLEAMLNGNRKARGKKSFGAR